MGPLHISFMERGDIEASANVLSHAMLHNPLHLAVFQGNGENARFEIERMFLKLFYDRPGIVFIAKEGGNIIGVMRMNSCIGKKSVNQPHDQKDLENVESRQAYWLGEWARRDPTEQHWHLGPIGVLPAYRGLGVGTRLMERFCDEVDKCSATAYLETDLDKNVIFYQKFGFEVLTRSTIFQVENTYMFRQSTE